MKRTLAAPVRHEIDPIRGSRFVADAIPVSDDVQAARCVSRIRSDLGDASHHCWAYRLAPEGVVVRASDAGEPRGAAGAPILRRLEGLDLVDALVVVTRWFGGTKLGVGGLMRAYGAAAAAVLANATLVAFIPMTRIQVSHPYSLEGRVRALLVAEGHEPLQAHYGADIRLVLALPESDLDAFVARLNDVTAGAARIERHSQ